MFHLRFVPNMEKISKLVKNNVVFTDTVVFTFELLCVDSFNVLLSNSISNQNRLDPKLNFLKQKFYFLGFVIQYLSSRV